MATILALGRSTTWLLSPRTGHLCDACHQPLSGQPVAFWRAASSALDQMNLRLHHVIADLSGLTGMAIIEAILAGERDPRQLAKAARSSHQGLSRDYCQGAGGQLARRASIRPGPGAAELEAGPTAVGPMRPEARRTQ